MRKPLRSLGNGLFISVLALSVTALGCAPQPKGAQARTVVPQAAGPGVAEIDLQVTPVTFGVLVVEHNTSGTVKPVMQSQVVGQLSGVVAQVLRKPGDWVDEGATVIQLDDSQLKLSVKIGPGLGWRMPESSCLRDRTRRNRQTRGSIFKSVRGVHALGRAERLRRTQGALQTRKGRPVPTSTGRRAISIRRRRTSKPPGPLSTRTRRPMSRTSPSTSSPSSRPSSLSSRPSSISACGHHGTVRGAARRGERHARRAGRSNAAAFIIASSEREVDFDVPPRTPRVCPWARPSPSP